ncbi:predicted protein [Arabidopsis lyrata subsp. lyrata]|uniref:Predicted protein n=1 Tax=Arabidopsis lyrata subsp. lyrata TaxID=81972 RepID=D7MSV4_ARALL|nr:predicted protein [Arabidopsis lyrata subsp. lyrata]
MSKQTITSMPMRENIVTIDVKTKIEPTNVVLGWEQPEATSNAGMRKPEKYPIGRKLTLSQTQGAAGEVSGEEIRGVFDGDAGEVSKRDTGEVSERDAGEVSGGETGKAVAEGGLEAKRKATNKSPVIGFNNNQQCGETARRLAEEKTTEQRSGEETERRWKSEAEEWHFRWWREVVRETKVLRRNKEKDLDLATSRAMTKPDSEQPASRIPPEAETS